MNMTGRQGEMSILAVISVPPSDLPRLAWRRTDSVPSVLDFGTKNRIGRPAYRCVLDRVRNCQPKQFRFNMFGTMSTAQADKCPTSSFGKRPVVTEGKLEIDRMPARV